MANTFEQEISASARAQGLVYQKLAVGYSPHRRFLEDNPYDSYAVWQGLHIPLELKSMEVHGSFPLQNITTGQIDGLTRMVQEGCRAFLLINMRRRVETLQVNRRVLDPVTQKRVIKRVREKKNRPDIQAWALDWRRWDFLLQTLQEQGDRKSIPYALFQDPLFFTPVTRVTFDTGDKSIPGWDLRAFLQGVI